MTSPEELEALVESYCNARTLIVESCLGAGTQDSVFVVTNSINNIRHAVKFHERKVAFERERAVYLRLKELEIDYVCGHRIPVLVAYDNEFAGDRNDDRQSAVLSGFWRSLSRSSSRLLTRSLGRLANAKIRSLRIQLAHGRKDHFRIRAIWHLHC